MDMHKHAIHKSRLSYVAEYAPITHSTKMLPTSSNVVVFVDYITQREALAAQLAMVFSIQADGSTDSGNIEDKLYLVVYSDPLTQDGKFLEKNS